MIKSKKGAETAIVQDSHTAFFQNILQWLCHISMCKNSCVSAHVLWDPMIPVDLIALLLSL